jgi:hypothetical protein
MRAGHPPVGWALVLLGLASTLTVLLFIPLAWDRYYLPIQAPAIIAGAALLDACAGRLRWRVRSAGSAS